MIHIAPWEATQSLMLGASRLLSPGAPLYLYGPYRRGGAHTSPSNAAFDLDLRARNATWGIRDIEAVEICAKEHELSLIETVAMPANNLSVIFRRK